MGVQTAYRVARGRRYRSEQEQRLRALVSGVPMARVLCPSAEIGAIMLPLMIFHQLQLMVCASIARRQGGVHDNPT